MSTGTVPHFPAVAQPFQAFERCGTRHHVCVVQWMPIANPIATPQLLNTIEAAFNIRQIPTIIHQLIAFTSTNVSHRRKARERHAGE